MQTIKFIAEDRFLLDRGSVYVGKAPFPFNNTERDKLRETPWTIEHPSAKGMLWRVIGIETFAIMHISEGTPIGLLVIPWEDRDE